jgi:hypothetical protein
MPSFGQGVHKMMNLTEISNIRIINQRIEKTEFGSAKELVSWMGAIQAQDFTMAELAIGIRILNSAENAIQAALNFGDIIRIHIMRPTWHFVAADDIYWMLALTSPQILTSIKSRHKQLELNDKVYSKSTKILEKALKDRSSLTREEISEEFSSAKIATDENRLSHLLLYAELNGFICSGPLKGKKQTYALLQERVPYKNLLSRDESLAELAKRYFTSHGPATIADFAWWSGLSLKDARRALEFIKSDFFSETTDLKEYWFKYPLINKRNSETNIHLLPAYDEFLISYKDRNASMTLSKHKNVISSNGIFYPLIVINGQVSGLWKCFRKNDKISIEINYFYKQDKLIKNKSEEIATSFGTFWGKESKVSFNSLNKKFYD